MASISLCMIVKNEEKFLPGCLDSVRGVADEIILVDTGSTDKTRLIGKEKGARICSFPWTDDFAAARNFSFSKATKDFILWMDGDDVLLPKDREKLIWRKDRLSRQVDMVMMDYHVDCDEQGKPAYTYYRERLVRREAGWIWQDPVHETIKCYGNNLETWDIAITHRRRRSADPGRNLRIMEKALKEKGRLEPRMQYYYGRELCYAGRYREAAQVLSGFLRENQGWETDRMGACLILSGCLELSGEMEKAKRVLLHSTVYGRPGAEICCQLGRLFLNQKQYRAAARWFETALSCERNRSIGGFVQTDCYDCLPYAGLALCCERLGEKERALWCSRQAARYCSGKVY